jgi:hypothetical protein
MEGEPMQQVTIQGTQYNVIRRAAGDGALTRIGALGYIYLVKAHGGKHLYQAIERRDGSISAPWNTRTTVDGASIYRTRAA